MTGKELLDEVLDGLPELEDGKNVITTLSGGMDSSIMAHLMVYKYGKERVKAISYNYGQRHMEELDNAKNVTKLLNIPHEIVDIRFLGEMTKNISSMVGASDINIPSAVEVSGDPEPSSFLPGRNLVMLSIAASFAGSNNGRYVVLSNNGTDIYGYPDATPAFTEAVDNVLSVSTRKNAINLISPFKELYKDEELKIAKELNNFFDRDIVKGAWSCYEGKLEKFNFKQCGKCPTDVERINGMILAGYSNEEIEEIYNLTLDEIQKMRGNQ